MSVVFVSSFNKHFKQTNIFVVDSNNDPVNVQLGYDSNTGSVTIKGLEGFKSGESYTLFIS